MMFSHYFTTRCAVQFIVVYGDLKGLLCFKRKSKIGDKDDITNLVIVKDAEVGFVFTGPILLLLSLRPQLYLGQV